MEQNISFQVSKATPLVLSEKEGLDLLKVRMEGIKEELSFLI